MGYKTMLNEEQWQQGWGSLTAETQQTLIHKYGV